MRSAIETAAADIKDGKIQVHDYMADGKCPFLAARHPGRGEAAIRDLGGVERPLWRKIPDRGSRRVRDDAV